MPESRVDGGLPISKSSCSSAQGRNRLCFPRTYRTSRTSITARTCVQLPLERGSVSEMRHVNLDGKLCIAVTDVFSGLSGKTPKAVAETLKLPHIAYKPEVIQLIGRLHKFPGRGQKEVPVVTQEEALELKDHLPVSYSGDLNAHMRHVYMQ
eukprot:1527739-Rhodomonas_salina.2